MELFRQGSRIKRMSEYTAGGGGISVQANKTGFLNKSILGSKNCNVFMVYSLFTGTCFDIWLQVNGGL